MRKNRLDLPDKFPISYAIVLEELNKSGVENDTLAEATRMSLWSQMIDYLKVTPLTINDLTHTFTKIVCYDKYKNKLLSYKELNGDKKLAEEKAMRVIKELGFGSVDIGIGNAFDLTLFNYWGMGETPVFHKVKNSKNVSAVPWLRNFGYHSSDGLKLAIEKKYEKLQKASTSEFGGFSSLQTPKVFYLDIPNSELWEYLNKNTGTISHNDIPDIKLKEIKGGEKITVAIAKNIEDLIEEELFALYKHSEYCLNCRKILPFNSKAKYCPNTKENVDCNKKRNKIRKTHSKMNSK